MAVTELEKRLADLETEVARLRRLVEPHDNGQAVDSPPADTAAWLNSIYGSCADDPIYEEAMRLGREYRESLRPSDDGEAPDTLPA